MYQEIETENFDLINRAIVAAMDACDKPVQLTLYKRSNQYKATLVQVTEPELDTCTISS